MAAVRAEKRTTDTFLALALTLYLFKLHVSCLSVHMSLRGVESR